MSLRSGRTVLTRPGIVVALLASAALVAPPPHPADAVVLGTLTTFPVVTNLSMDIKVTVHWKGIKAGCFAPQEDFDVVHTFSFDTHPNGKKSKVRPGTATLNAGPLVPEFFGATATLGAPGGAKQSGKAGSWILETQYPGGCGPDPAPPVPASITAPNCKAITERVSVSAEISEPGEERHGVLTIRRTPSANRTAAEGAGMGASCHRTFHDISFSTEGSQAAIFENMTFIRVPVPNLRARLDRLVDSPPSAPLIFSISGECGSAAVRPSIGPVSGFEKRATQPHDSIGQAWSDTGNNTCTISGTGKVSFARVGKVRTTPIFG
jgi:hypothetical protein